MLISTWNVNSVRARLPRLESFLREFTPDVLLLQETKCSPEQFPHGEIAELGYRALDHSGGRWCGVAILVPSDMDATGVEVGLPGEPDPSEARWVEATVGDGLRVVSVYIPNGREVESEHFASKLRFFEAAAARVRELGATGGDLIVGGDMNVAPTDSDVWDVTRFEGATHVTAAERDALASLRESGPLVDAHVAANGDEQLFTWWDYRGGSFHRGFGMRIDHLLLSPTMAERIESVGIAREYRKGEKPSDHVPVLLRTTD